MLTLSTAGAEFIARWEGFKPTVYRCPAGYPTIGYGHRLRPGEAFIRITEGQALDLLMEDAVREAAPVAAALLVPLNPYQADALISVAFNVGGYAIAKSTLLKKLNAGQIVAAADQFLAWNKVRKHGVLQPERGLTRRRNAERNLFLFADYTGAP
jgi:lysozyme